MDATVVLTQLQKELRDALRNRWLWLFAVAFGALALGLGRLGLTETAGVLGFGRTMAGLINLTLLLVPLMALALGAQSVAGERERRTLPYLLTQPVGRTELLVGKYLGLALALAAALGSGFGVAGLALGSARIDPAAFAGIAALALLLALASLSLGLLVSVMSRKTTIALGVALFIWMALALLADLGLMGAALAGRLRADGVFLLALANPLQLFKLASIQLLRPSLDVLGPAGLYGATRFGLWLMPLLVGLLAVWTALPLAAASVVFARRAEG